MPPVSMWPPLAAGVPLAAPTRFRFPGVESERLSIEGAANKAVGAAAGPTAVEAGTADSSCSSLTEADGVVERPWRTVSRSRSANESSSRLSAASTLAIAISVPLPRLVRPPCRQRLAAYLSAASLVSSASAISIAALASREPNDAAARCEPAFFGASDESAEARAPATIDPLAPHEQPLTPPTRTPSREGPAAQHSSV
jgi:hypothetical protein